MTASQLKMGRKGAGLTQRQAAATLGVSQPYLALLEAGRRSLTPKIGRRIVEIYHLPPTALPMDEPVGANSEVLARELAALGHPGFLYLRSRDANNPAAVLLAALSSGDLEVRVTEALPWLVRTYPDMDWEYLCRESKQREIQNRLGYVLSLARRLAELCGDDRTAARLGGVTSQLDRARLVREDTLCQSSLSEAERRWLRKRRPREARHWNLLTDLGVERPLHAA